MPETLIKVDLSKSAYDNDMIHNRWHPDIPMVSWVNPGDDFIIETYDWTGGFIKNNNSADDVRDIDLSIVHFLSGPIGVKGAEPGDLLVVDLLDVGPLKESLWGFNGFFSKKNGGGFLTDHFPLAQKSIWDIKGLYTSSRHVPGVSFARLAASQGRRHQGRRGEIRHQEPRVQAVADHAELQGLSDLRGHLGRRGRQAALPRRPHRLSHGLPQRDRISEEVRLFGRAGLF